MSKKGKDKLITKEKTQSDCSSINPLDELLNLIELVNEFGIAYRVKTTKLHNSQSLRERLYSEAEVLIESFYDEESWTGSDPMPVIVGKKQITNEEVVEEIRRAAKDLPKLYNFLFGNYQNLYPKTSKRYERSTKSKGHEMIEGVIEKYDDILRFASNLTQMAILSNIHIKEFGIERFKQIKLRQHYYLDMPSSRYYINNGRFNFESDLLAYHLQDVEATRLRYCLICQSVFWAHDLRKIYCSRTCSNRDSQRKWYAKTENKEKFLRDKKAEYHIRKESARFPSRVNKNSEEK